MTSLEVERERAKGLAGRESVQGMDVGACGWWMWRVLSQEAEMRVLVGWW